MKVKDRKIIFKKKILMSLWRTLMLKSRVTLKKLKKRISISGTVQ